MNLDISPEDITAAFRLKANGPKDKVRPVMVKFKSVELKNQVMRAKKKLTEDKSTTFVSEHLTKAAGELFAKARALKKQSKVHKAYTYNGNVYVRLTSDPTARPTLIKSVDDLPR